MRTRRRWKRRCVVCGGEVSFALFLCRACERSYDRANLEDSTTAGIIRWAAQRALRCERQRVKGRRLG
jgi:hypothetical protein